VRRPSRAAAALLAWPTVALAHGDPIVLLAPYVFPALQLVAVATTLACALLLPGAVASIVSVAVALIARASKVRLRFLVEWVIRSFVLSYGLLVVALALAFRAGAGALAVPAEASSPPADWTIRWFVAIQAGGWTGMITYLLLAPVPMLALLVAFFVRRGAYRRPGA
jgi:hypothetical protein